jgi:hypothetical protein
MILTSGAPSTQSDPVDHAETAEQAAENAYSEANEETEDDEGDASDSDQDSDNERDESESTNDKSARSSPTDDPDYENNGIAAEEDNEQQYSAVSFKQQSNRSLDDSGEVSVDDFQQKFDGESAEDANGKSIASTKNSIIEEGDDSDSDGDYIEESFDDEPSSESPEETDSQRAASLTRDVGIELSTHSETTADSQQSLSSGEVSVDDFQQKSDGESAEDSNGNSIASTKNSIFEEGDDSDSDGDYSQQSLSSQNLGQPLADESDTGGSTHSEKTADRQQSLSSRNLGQPLSSDEDLGTHIEVGQVIVINKKKNHPKLKSNDEIETIENKSSTHSKRMANSQNSLSSRNDGQLKSSADNSETHVELGQVIEVKEKKKGKSSKKQSKPTKTWGDQFQQSEWDTDDESDKDDESDTGGSNPTPIEKTERGERSIVTADYFSDDATTVNRKSSSTEEAPLSDIHHMGDKEKPIETLEESGKTARRRYWCLVLAPIVGCIVLLFSICITVAVLLNRDNGTSTEVNSTSDNVTQAPPTPAPVRWSTFSPTRAPQPSANLDTIALLGDIYVSKNFPFKAFSYDDDLIIQTDDNANIISSILLYFDLTDVEWDSNIFARRKFFLRVHQAPNDIDLSSSAISIRHVNLPLNKGIEDLTWDTFPRNLINDFAEKTVVVYPDEDFVDIDITSMVLFSTATGTSYSNLRGMNRELYSDFAFFLLLESSERATYKVFRSRDYQKGAFKATLIHEEPTPSPSMVPSAVPSSSLSPSVSPTTHPSSQPTESAQPSAEPTLSVQPTLGRSNGPTLSHTVSSNPSVPPSRSSVPSAHPSGSPSISLTATTFASLSMSPSIQPSQSFDPTLSYQPTSSPSLSNPPSIYPSSAPSSKPSTSARPSISAKPSIQPTPSLSKTTFPSNSPSASPSLSTKPSSSNTPT